MSVTRIPGPGDRFRVRFDRLGRRVRDIVGGREVSVDPYRIALALRRTMRHCLKRDATGGRLVWNEYVVFLSSEDHAELRELMALLRSQIKPQLDEEAERLGARLVGDWCVRLQVDHQQELPRLNGEVHPRFVASEDLRDPTDGELTARFRPSIKVAPTVARLSDPVTGAGRRLRLRWPGGALTLERGDRRTLGRSHANPPSDHLPLAGASEKISRQHLWIEFPSDASCVYVARLEEGNPVRVDGEDLAPGARARVPVERLPVRVGLSGGALVLRIGLEE